ncbi:MAG: hypothetical protein JST84_09135 [Acidobacteria bacterium]|nr:hypothetical protein [Acidobacteriota bacterium]
MHTHLASQKLGNILQKRVFFSDGLEQQQGTIEEAYLHPTRGELLGFIIKPENKTAPLLLAINQLLLLKPVNTESQLAALSHIISLVEELGDGVMPYQEFLTAEVITEDGQYCGCIAEVYFCQEGLRTIYQLKTPGLRGLFSKPQFVEGSHSDFYSRRYHRLILAAGAPRFASLTEAVEGLQQTALAFVGDDYAGKNFQR